MGVLYAVDGTSAEMKPANGSRFTLEEVWAVVGRYHIELVRLQYGAPGFLLVNDEGRLTGLPHNPGASTLAGQPILGPAILTNEEEFD